MLTRSVTRRWLLLLGLVLSLSAVAWAQNWSAGDAPAGGFGAPVARSAPASGPIEWRILENPNGPNTALFFDPVRQVFAVYHVDSASGQIMLRSVRSLSADLRLEQYNSSSPAPKDIRGMLEEAR